MTCHEAACKQPIAKAAHCVAIVGNPNCGKTTLFNALTGASQRVGNWPGVTVERKSGICKIGQHALEVVDLPGVYSLVMASETASVDEGIACDYILTKQADLFINIVDASHLERNLYLTMQLREMGVPMIVVLNMMDVARARALQIDVRALEKKLACPVLILEAHKAKGVQALKQALLQCQAPSVAMNEHFMPTLLPYIQILQAQLQTEIPEAALSQAFAIRLLERDVYAEKKATPATRAHAHALQAEIANTLQEDADILIADARYQAIQNMMKTCVHKTKTVKTTWTERIDSIVLHKFLGLPIFFAVMYAMFLFAINVGGAFQDFFDISSDAIFVQGFAHLLSLVHVPNVLTVLLANGVGKGINTTVTFIPVIGAMFLFLAFLEDSGYMARAAFVVDRVMRALGLPGKSFVPMIIGFGCNVPAVMAARTLENKRDRILTILMSPFMSCGARLAIYAIFTAAFFPVGGQNVVFALYLIGIAMAMLTGLLLRKTILPGEPAPLVMELPPYHLPRLRTLMLLAWQRLQGFVLRAGKLILPICMILGALGALHLDGSLNAGDADANSLLAWMGRLLTPLFGPMGISADNWPATVGLVTGVLAKEVVVGTLNTLYSQVAHLNVLSASSFHFWGSMREAVMSVPQNLSALGQSLGNPLLAEAPIQHLNQSVYGEMYRRFDGQIGAFAYLLFVLLYFPCVSTTAAMVRELNKGWAIFSVLWSSGVAYAVAVLFYQAATWMRHPLSSSLWIAGLFAVFLLVVQRVYLRGHPRVSVTTLATEGVSS